MTIFQAIVLGLVQGFSEFLPISSSAHLTLVPWLFGWEDPGLDVDVALHLGTLIALVWYFWQEWMLMLRAAVMIVVNRRVENESERRLVWVVVATIPGAAAGFFLRDYAATVFRSPTLIASALIAMGVVLWLVDRAADKTRGITEMKLADAVLIGLAQMLAIVPGVSRSGSTITAGRALKFSREGAAVFSFLMSLPITLAAVIVETPKAIAQHGFSLALIAGVVASAVSGWLAISVLLKFVARRSYGIFAAYRLVLGAIVLGLVYMRS